MSVIRNPRLLSTALLGVLAPMILAMGSHTAQAAVVYCKYIGVPKGCIVRPGVVLAPAPVVVAPVARARVVAAPVTRTTVVVAPGVGAPGVGVRPGTPVNRGGPVNRVGRR